MNPKIESGTRAMLALRDERLAAGEQPLGWKVGFGSPAAFARLGTDRPLAGFLLRSGVLPDGASVDISGWTNPHLELEIAARVAADGSIAATGAAIELVDTHPVSTDAHEILAGNIYHRHVILGPFDDTRDDGEGVSGRLVKDGEEVVRADNPAEATGEIVGVVERTLDLLRSFGVTVQDGDVVITGSVFPPVPVGLGHYRVELPPLGALEVDLTG